MQKARTQGEKALKTQLSEQRLSRKMTVPFNDIEEVKSMNDSSGADSSGLDKDSYLWSGSESTPRARKRRKRKDLPNAYSQL